MSYKCSLEWLCRLAAPQLCRSAVATWSVPIPVAEIVEEIQLRVVVVDQTKLVVLVVGGLAAPHHSHGPCLTEASTPVGSGHAGTWHEVDVEDHAAGKIGL